MCYRTSLLTLLLLTAATLPATAEPRLKDLKNYQPPPMFGNAPVAKPVPSQTAVEPPVPVAPAASAPAIPKTEDILSFSAPAKNEIVTRNRQSGGEEKVSSARPDYSDSHTVLHIGTSSDKPAESKPVKKAAAPAKKTPSKAAPANKPAAVELASTKSNDTSDASPDSGRYVPTARATMPTVRSVTVERTQLDPYVLPPSIKTKSSPPAAPSTNEALMDQALKREMASLDKNAITAAVDNAKPVASTAPPAAASPVLNPLLSMEFKAGLIDLQPDQKSQLQKEVLLSLEKNETSRLKIIAFAVGRSENDSRRLSLSRALAVRSYLIAKGVAPARLDIRAMGETSIEKPRDRVDLAIIGS